MKNGENYSYSRRKFLINSGLALAFLPIWNACKDFVSKWAIKLSGTNHILGHRLWLKDFPKPTETLETSLLIIGGGISGLSAARHLSQNDFSDFLILELENEVGGNSSHHQNKYSKYPLGAHYLPLPNLEDKELLSFLEESEIIMGYENDIPVFDEMQLCFMPQERMFHKGEWVEGLIPQVLSTDSIQQFQKFQHLMSVYSQQKGTDGKFAFDIPIHWSSQDEELKKLDLITMSEWLKSENLNSTELLKYIDYCCRDDYGLGVKYVSAWAGIHYFAGRKNNYHKESDAVLTWPEGNSRLTKHLKKYTEGKVLKNSIAYEIKIIGEKVEILFFDNLTQTSKRIICDKVLLATPQFINQYLIPERKQLTQNFHYAPWILATLTVKDLRQSSGISLAWDNIIQSAKGLGYIYNQHQEIGQIHEHKVITWYHSFSSNDLKLDRKKLLKNDQKYWEKWILDDLKIAHPDIESYIESIEIYKIGHGMISPVPGFLTGNAKQMAAESIQDKIFFAHSDLSGISIFEEAFHQGIHVANKILKS